jgi:hypothetical protein
MPEDVKLTYGYFACIERKVSILQKLTQLRSGILINQLWFRSLGAGATLSYSSDDAKMMQLGLRITESYATYVKN